MFDYLLVWIHCRVKGGANILSNAAEKAQMDKEADDVMHSLFIFMEDK